MTIKDFIVGDKVYMRNYHYRSSEDNATMEEAIVSAVGTKYVTIMTSGFYGMEYKFKKACNGEELYLVEKKDAGTPNKLFKTMGDYDNWKEKIEKLKFIRDYFGNACFNLSLDKIREIVRIIEEG